MPNEQELTQKVDRILLLLEGEKHAPGLVERMESMEKTVNGNGEMGLKQKVTFMWRAHVWVAGLAGTGVGSLITYALAHIK